MLPQAVSAAPLGSGQMARNCSTMLGIGSAVQGGLDPLDPQHLEVIQRLLPVLNGFPLGDHVPQRQVPSHATKGVRQ